MAIPKSNSIAQFVANVKANIQRYCAAKTRAHQGTFTDDNLTQLPYSPTTFVRMAAEARLPQVEYTTRTLDQEIDTVAICPSHPDYMIIGTYSLVKNDSQASYVGQSRLGSLRVMTVSSTFKPSYAGMLPPELDRIDLPCAVLDIHFHPEDPTLLGVATSNARVYFYRFVVHGDVLGRRVTTKLVPLGSVRVSDDDEHGLTPLVTQFTWFDEIRSTGPKGLGDVIIAALAATTSFGEARLLKISVPAIRDLFDDRIGKEEVSILSSSEVVHKHDLEAWCIASINFNTLKNTETNDGGGQRLVLTGGDDSALLASLITPSMPDWPPVQIDEESINATQVWKDRRNHSAGVVAILSLASPSTTMESNQSRPQTIPLLTGSYDESVRIFEIDPTTYRGTLKTELKLNGGVWRLKVLDEYTTNQNHGTNEYHYLLLASLMHAGAAIIRITYTTSSTGEVTWTIKPLTTFTAGHESMVYCCDARLENPDASQQENAYDEAGNKLARADGMAAEPPTYTIVSTSFYDMKICTWKFVDEFKVHNQGK
ncbi:hypothetical protein H2200_011627 [Cladophialophora chaetospira]|uniref:Uncharacterized protein n=1 Tax=Cladophialophora chaetospira TaxID=386627 RepID=A0AA38WZP5_9EURO|nr:hypothetical protein H2200_011627 [Cladophialophora chaetospira]